MGNKVFILALAINLFFVQQVIAATPSPDFSSCAALREESAYGKKYEDYAWLIPGKDGWFFRSKQDMRMEFDIDGVNLALWQKLSKTLKDKGTDLVVAYIPTRAMAAQAFLPGSNPLAGDYDPAKARQSYAGFIAKMNNEGLYFAGTPETKEAGHYFNKADQHWTQAGAKEMAKAVAAFVHQLPSWQSVPKMEFKTNVVKNVSFEGKFNDALKHLCGKKTLNETDIETRTVPISGDISETALFDDLAPPKIVLVGTSNSKKEDNDPNFEGHLKTALGADVYNAAVTGGGFDDSIITYLDSEAFGKSPPKILIWEIPGYYDLSGNTVTKTLRQAIAGVYGMCENPLAASNPQKLSGPKLVLLDGLSGKNIGMSGSYVALKFDAPVQKDFTAVFSGPKGKVESYRFKHPRIKGGNRFYYAPAGRKDTVWQSIALNIPEKMLGLSVQAQICESP